MNKDEFDQLFDRVFDESVQNHKFTPDTGPSWEKVQLQLAKRRRRRSQLRALPYVAASFLLGAFLFGSPAASNAFQPLFQAVVTIKDDIVRIVIGEPGNSKVTPKTPPPPESKRSDPDNTTSSGVINGTITPVTYETWEEAMKALDFKVPAIQYIVEGYDLSEVNIFYDNGRPRVTHIAYSDENGILYTINFNRIPVGAVFQSGGGPGIDIQTSRIGSIETYIFTTNDGYIAQEFMINDIHVSISGPLSHDETQKIAEELIKGML